MKKIKQIPLLLLLLVAGINSPLAAQELNVNYPLSPNAAVEVATRDLPNLLQLIEPADLQDYGFNKSDNFSNIEIGRPFYLLTLPGGASASSSSSTIYSSTNSIMLPIILNNQARCFIYISNEEGKWKSVGIGGGHYAASRPEIFNVSTDQDGSSFAIVNMPKISQDYFVSYGKDIEFIPLINYESGEYAETLSLNKLLELNNQFIQKTVTNEPNDINK